MVQPTLPHKRVAGNEFTRRNGAFTLNLLAPSAVGLPYGTVRAMDRATIAAVFGGEFGRRMYNLMRLPAHPGDFPTTTGEDDQLPVITVALNLVRQPLADDPRLNACVLCACLDKAARQRGSVVVGARDRSSLAVRDALIDCVRRGLVGASAVYPYLGIPKCENPVQGKYGRLSRGGRGGRFPRKHTRFWRTSPNSGVASRDQFQSATPSIPWDRRSGRAATPLSPHFPDGGRVSVG